MTYEVVDCVSCEKCGAEWDPHGEPVAVTWLAELEEEERPSQAAVDAYFTYCAEHGGFDSVQDARDWAERSISFQEQVRAHALTLDRFAARFK